MIEVTEITPAYVEQLVQGGVTLQYRKTEGGSETKIHYLFPKTM